MRRGGGGGKKIRKGAVWEFRILFPSLSPLRLLPHLLGDLREFSVNGWNLFVLLVLECLSLYSLSISASIRELDRLFRDADHAEAND